MITVVDAYPRQGYSRCDHLITGHECDQVIGRMFRSVAEARRAAERALQRNGDEHIATYSPVGITVLFANGREEAF
jgi:hypothetical protein